MRPYINRKVQSDVQNKEDDNKNTKLSIYKENPLNVDVQKV